MLPPRLYFLIANVSTPHLLSHFVTGSDSRLRPFQFAPSLNNFQKNISFLYIIITNSLKWKKIQEKNNYLVYLQLYIYFFMSEFVMKNMVKLLSLTINKVYRSTTDTSIVMVCKEEDLFILVACINRSFLLSFSSLGVNKLSRDG